MGNSISIALSLVASVGLVGCGSDFVKARVKIVDERVMYRGQTVEIDDSRTIKTILSWFPDYDTPDADHRTLMAPWEGAGTIELVQRDGKKVKIDFDERSWRVTDPKPGTSFRPLEPGFWKYLGTLFIEPKKAGPDPKKK
jgi:hypothetical protein